MSNVTDNSSSHNLSDEQRLSIYHILLEKSSNGKLRRGVIQEVAKKFGVSGRTVSRIWHRGKESSNSSRAVADVSSRIKKNSGRKSKDENELKEAVRSVDMRNRGTIRKLSTATGIPRSTLQDAKKRGTIVRHSSTLKPLLTESNKLARMNFALSFIERVSNNRSNRRRHYEASKNINSPFQNYFDSFHNFILIDEKWFRLTQEKANVYLTPEEKDPYRSTKSKNFIPKVMFLCAVARPRYDSQKKSYFDGKIGIWPFVERVPAQRNSRNRPAGTLELKPLNVTKDVYREFLITKVLPDIRAKFPVSYKERIFIQQDNARPHISIHKPEFIEESQKQGWNIQLTCQPPNSPDFNVLDLGFFNSIQSLQQSSSSKNIEELISNVKTSFDNLSLHTLNKTFLTLQKSMESSLGVHGGNEYRLSHSDYSGLSTSQMMDFNHSCDEHVYSDALHFIESHSISSHAAGPS